MTKINGSAYFCGDSKKDVWTVTNEAAAEAARDGNHKFSEFYNLGQGFFSYAPPEFMTEQGKKALENIPANQYSPVRGQPILVDALSKLYSPVYKKQLKPENIQVTTGANVGIFACLMSLLNPGDEVIVLEPFFDQYIYNIKVLGGIVKHVPLTPPKDLKTRRTKGSEWTLDFDQFRSAISEKTKAVIINSPHNPTGKVFTREELLTLGNICVEKNVYIISDEVYENLYFTPECVKLASLSPEISNITLTIGSAGKIFAVTGWRIGWIISENVELLKLASSAHIKICFSSPSPPQLACAHAIDIALNSDYFDRMRKDYIEKVEILTSVFEELGMPYTVPEGSYFIVVDFSKLKIP
ncbi:pyridoxal phosphate-dependent aminotransferase Ecym_6319 [Eremothecium cymbalariae DBVPG|uniref:Aminotransferase class I/classII large domain-containing protein n=1 Tax=Eremothecium cymbalariae (strain CBS 270.75 / DBVPG 7215 / KCTC 17166 / NRRL Y-17582) TaxID=931890 RepID=G8JUB7_ERECY|nr:hypothetical protein Ecym_6319 [Eremothecium cymbalariae DBVPG\